MADSPAAQALMAARLRQKPKNQSLADWLAQFQTNRQPQGPPPSPFPPPPARQQPPQGDAAMRQALGNVIGLRGPHWTR